MNNPIVKAIILVALAGAILRGQNAAPTNTAANTAPAALPQEEGGDLFRALRLAADEARKVYEKVYENIREVDRLLASRRCQSTRVSGLLDRTNASLDAWLTAERLYWTSWNETESRRVEGQQISLASLEADQKRAADLLESDKQDREELMRRKASLEKSPRTTQITAEIDGLIKDIQDGEARLTEDQRQFDEITASLNNMKASISARLVNIRQNIYQLDAFRLDEHARYEDKRKAAQEICNTRQPGEKAPLPRHGSGGR